MTLGQGTPSQASSCSPKSGGSYASCVVTGDLSNADLSDSTFFDVEFQNVNLDGANFSNSTFTRTFGIFAERANFNNSRFIESSLGPNELGNCGQGASLMGSTFHNTVFYKTAFNCVTNASAALSDFKMMASIQCFPLTNDLFPVYTIYVNKGSRGNGKYSKCGSGGTFWGFSKNNLYRGSDFQSGLDFSEWEFSGADLSGSSFIGVNLTNADFLGSDLTNVDFSGSNLLGAKFEGSNLQGVDLSPFTNFGFCFRGTPASIPDSAKVLGNCVIRKAGGSELIKANFEGLDLSQVTMYSCLLCNLQRTKLNGFNAGSLVESNLVGANISKMNLTNVDLARSNLQGLDLSKRVFRSSLVGANLANTKLQLADFSNSSMQGSILTGANISGTIFPSSSSMSGIKSGKLIGVPKKLPKFWKVANGWLVGPGADLIGANLSKQDLTSTSLSGANLQGAVLPGAKLSSQPASFKIVGKPKTLPTGWSFVAGKLIKKR